MKPPLRRGWTPTAMASRTWPSSRQPRRATRSSAAFQRHFAEGATSTPLLPFTTRIALANPYPDPEPVRIEYALGIGTAPPTELTLAPWQRTTIVANEQPGLSSAEFGFRVLSTRPIGIDRTMTWDDWHLRRAQRRGCASPLAHVVLRGRRDHRRFPAVLPAAEPVGHDTRRHRRPVPAGHRQHGHAALHGCPGQPLQHLGERGDRRAAPSRSPTRSSPRNSAC